MSWLTLSLSIVENIYHEAPWLTGRHAEYEILHPLQKIISRKYLKFKNISFNVHIWLNPILCLTITWLLWQTCLMLTVWPLRPLGHGAVVVAGDVAGPGGQLEVRVQVVHHHVVLRGQVRHAVGVRHDLVCVADHTTHVSGHYSCTTSSTLEKVFKNQNFFPAQLISYVFASFWIVWNDI